MNALLQVLVVSSVVAGVAAQRPTAVLDPTGVLAFEVGGAAWQLRFPELDWPGPGELPLGTGGLRLGRASASGFAPVESGRIVVRSLGVDRVELTAFVVENGEPPVEIAVDQSVELRRLVEPVVRGAPAEIVRAELLPPETGDLVFCAIGSAGTGLPGQRRVAASILRTAKEQGLDFVLLLGDQFQPNGLAARDDPNLQRCFEDVFEAGDWPYVFYAVNGDAELRGDPFAPMSYSATSPRFSMSRANYAFAHALGDRSVQFVACDTRAIIGKVSDPGTRFARSIVARSMTGENPGWRIVFGHDPYYSHAADVDTAVAETLRSATESWLERSDVDVYIGGGTHALELLGPKSGVLHVNSGGGGGPEVARTVDWLEDTRFAATGGGSVWFRVRPGVLEVSFRDVDGRLLFVHHVEKPR